MRTPIAAETRLAVILRREAELHEAGWPRALGAGLEELERAVPRQPGFERARGALAFWRRWLAARDRDWAPAAAADGPPDGAPDVDEWSWPALARALADALDAGTTASDPRLDALTQPGADG